MTALAAIFLAGVAGLVGRRPAGRLARAPRCRPRDPGGGHGAARRERRALSLTGAEPLGAAFRSDVAPALGLDALSGVLRRSCSRSPRCRRSRSRATTLARPAARAALAALTAAFLLALAGLLAARDVVDVPGASGS